MPFFWQKSAGAVRHASDDMLAVDEKLVGEPIHKLRLTDEEEEEAHIIHNLVELHLIDPGEEECFLRRKEREAGLCLDERNEGRVAAAPEGWTVLSLLVREPAGSLWTLLLHFVAVLLAVTGRRFLYQTKELLKANKLGGDQWAGYEYKRFWSNGAADVLPLLVVPIVWLVMQFSVRVCRRSIVPMLSSIYEITMIVLLIYFPTVSIAMDGYKWQEVLDTFGSHDQLEQRINTLSELARQYKLAGLLCVYPIAAIYLVIITTRILTAIATLARGTASPGTVLYWLHRRGHTAASGLYLITAIMSAVGASMNIWNGMWYSWHSEMEHITATWSASGFPLQTVFLAAQVLAFLGLCVCAVAGDAPTGKACRRFSSTMAVVLAYSVFTCTMGIIAMDEENNKWAAQTTKPRHMVAVLMAAITFLIHTFIALCPALTHQAAY
ncbi:hypothetical protein VE01_00814 [Pseudogymnoascus verrucosus]|uniref:Uncharacterized protein n=1 Tax=Pseudogymnoascus verrucosus TaxID=342668 RepID=A0A2P2SWE0_9PEZI|nr:uncharacterized protein VE01_00814 [Pseudogymnoascus verrucosus]OBU01132.1 hypothetical protein VE01_00814 [Pseudogymnoascus verrucosus]